MFSPQTSLFQSRPVDKKTSLLFVFKGRVQHHHTLLITVSALMAKSGRWAQRKDQIVLKCQRFLINSNGKNYHQHILRRRSAISQLTSLSLFGSFLLDVDNQAQECHWR